MNNRLLTMLAVVGLVAISSNLFVTCLAIGKVRRASSDFVVTESMFRDAVDSAISNYVSSVAHELQESHGTDQRTVVVEFLEGLVIYYRPLRRCWVARYRGCDFVVGDYFDSGVVQFVAEGRMYVKSPEGVRILRPVAASERPLGPPPRDEPEPGTL